MLYDEEVYDDNDFYQMQLKEFISSSAINDLERTNQKPNSHSNQRKRNVRSIQKLAKETVEIYHIQNC